MSCYRQGQGGTGQMQWLHAATPEMNPKNENNGGREWLMYVPNDAMRWCTAWAGVGVGAEQAMCACWWSTGSKELPVAPPPQMGTSILAHRGCEQAGSGNDHAD